MKVVMKHIDEITPSTTAIDMHHYHMNPFRAKKSLVFQDLTPIVLHKNTKVLKSQTSLKTFKNAFGQTVKVDSESDLYDHKTVSDAWKTTSTIHSLLAGSISQRRPSRPMECQLPDFTSTRLP